MNAGLPIHRQQDELPCGTVPFLFTESEGSTLLLAHLGEAFADLLSE
ncbi:MAG: hypothetical protein V3T55_09345 [Anaerolineales bacterium]